MTPTKDNLRPSTKPTSLPGFENEGEGNKTAARRYDAAQEAYVASGKSEAAAQAAKEAYDGPEGASLRQAEAIGLAQKNIRVEDVTDDAQLEASERVTEVDPLNEDET